MCAQPLVAAYTSPFTVLGEREACARPASAVAAYTSLIPSGERHVHDLWWVHTLFFSSFPVGCARLAWFLHAA